MHAGLCILACGMLGFVVGCSVVEPQVTPVNRDVYRTLPPPPQEVPPRYEGSLFSGENGRNMFFVDRKARAVNDVVTVRIADVTSATGQANTNTSRASSVAGSLDNVFGFKPGSIAEAQL